MGAKEGHQASRELIFYYVQEYGKRKDLKGGRRVFSAFIHDGLESISVLGDHLIRLFADCGSLVDANHVFRSISRPTIFTWNSIIAANAKNGRAERALLLYGKMRNLGFQPDKVAFLTAVKACGSMQSLSCGKILHNEIIMLSLEDDSLIANSLIGMYANCGLPFEAYAAFVRLATINVVSWTVMISAFAQCSFYMFSFYLYNQMVKEGIPPNKITFIATLQACIYSQHAEHGKIIHDQIIKRGCIIDKELGSIIIDMYSNCGHLQESHKVFDGLVNRDVISWLAMISGHVQNGDGAMAIKLYFSMQEEGIKPDEFIYSSILRACTIERATQLGELIHGELQVINLHLHPVTGTALIDMHAEFGNLQIAQKLFDEFPKATEISWELLIKGYVRQGSAFSALQIFEKMQKDSIRPSTGTCIFVLKACISLQFYRHGKLIHDQILRLKFEKDSHIESSIVGFYAQSGRFDEALSMFRKSDNHDSMMWGVLLEGYMQHDLMDSVFQVVECMKEENVILDTFAYSCAVKACTLLRNLRLVHDYIIKDNFERDAVVSNALISVYSGNGSIEEAHHLFQNLQNKDVASWTAFMQGLIEGGSCSSVFDVFEKMQQSGVQPSDVTYLCLLKACVVEENVHDGMLVHDDMVRSGLVCEKAIGNALLDMYGTCGHVYDAQNIFCDLKCQDEVSWGTMMSVYSQHGYEVQALELFQKMQSTGLKQTIPMLHSTLKACINLGAILWGKLIHYLAIIGGFENDQAVMSTFIYMYAECGYMIEAYKLFNTLPNRDMVTWSILIGQLCGNIGVAKQLLTDTKHQNINLNAQLFTNIITACAREGLLEEGEDCFEILGEEHKIGSNLWHCTSMANLLCKTGHTEEAYDLLQAVPVPLDQAIWRALLSGCKCHEDMQMGESSFGRSINKMDNSIDSQDGRPIEATLSRKVEAGKLNNKILSQSSLRISNLAVEDTIYGLSVPVLGKLSLA